MKQFVVASFYKFAPIEEYESLKKPILKLMKDHELLGTVILAHEGINGSVSGTPENIQYFYDYIHSLPEFTDLKFKENEYSIIPFEKAKVKFRKEICTLGVDGINPLSEVGTYLSPEEWNELLSEPDVVLIDTRNDYEYGIGTFKNAINPNTENFREFPDYVKENMMDKKDKKIAMFCTGGIRCEKSTAYMKSLGFEKVYHLKDGILNYMETMPKEKSLWEGSCFVFDDRIAVDAE